jgi:hypothetical protein
MLGEDQWLWLENTLIQSKEKIIFIVTGTQFLPFTRLVTESWYAESRIRLMELIGKLKKNGIVLLSGDIHASQVLKTPCVHPDIGYDLYEITSSGMSHYSSFKFLFNYFLSNNYDLSEIIDTYNFAEIYLEWKDPAKGLQETLIKINIVDIENVVRLNYTISYDQLVYRHVKNEISSNSRDCKTRLYSRFKSISEYISYYKNNIFDLIIMLVFYIGIGLILYYLIICVKYVFTFIKNYLKSILVRNNKINSHQD